MYCKKKNKLPDFFLQVILGFGEPAAIHLNIIDSPTFVVIFFGSSIHFGCANKKLILFQNRKTFTKLKHKKLENKAKKYFQLISLENNESNT